MKKVYIGLDVHKENIVIALAFAGRSDPESYGKASSDQDRFLTILRRIQKTYEIAKEEISLCYEAGPTGFVLCRRLRDLGYECEVIAPSSIPKKSGDRIKTDRRDARKLARLFRAGDLTYVYVPDRTDEIIRDVGRARTDAVEARMRARQQLGGLLLRNGYHYTGKSARGEAHMRYLREMVSKPEG